MNNEYILFYLSLVLLKSNKIFKGKSDLMFNFNKRTISDLFDIVKSLI